MLDECVDKHPFFVKFREKQKEVADRRAPCLLLDHPQKIREICAEAEWFPAKNMPQGYLEGDIATVVDVCSRQWHGALQNMPAVPECVKRDPAGCVARKK